jgi:hypothetical protein
MAVNMSANMSMIRSRATVNLFGLMVAATKVTGKAVSSMERESTLLAKDTRSTANGRMERESDGSARMAKLLVDLLAMSALNDIPET